MIKAEFDAQQSPHLVLGDMLTPTESPLLTSEMSPVLDRHALFEHLSATYSRGIEDGVGAARPDMVSLVGVGRANTNAPFSAFHGADAAPPSAFHQFGDPVAGTRPLGAPVQHQPMGLPFRRHSVPSDSTAGLFATMTPAQVEALMTRFDASRFDMLTDEESAGMLAGAAAAGDGQHGAATAAMTAAGGHYFARTLDDLTESERLARRRMQNRESAHRRRLRNKTMRQELQEENEELRQHNAILMQTVDRLRARLAEYDPEAAERLTELPQPRKRSSIDGNAPV